MNKFGKRTVGGLVALAMAAGVGVAFGAITKEATPFFATTADLSAWDTEHGTSTYADGSIKFDGSGDFIQKNELFSGTLTSLSVTVNCRSNSGPAEGNVYTVSALGSDGNVLTSVSKGGNDITTSYSDLVFTFSSGFSAATGLRLTYTTKASGGGNWGVKTVSYSVTTEGGGEGGESINDLPEMPDGDYQKITSSSDLVNGYYLLVSEEVNKAFDGSLANLDSQAGAAVTISDDHSITTTSTIDQKALYISSIEGANKFSIVANVKEADPVYIGRNATSNGLETSNEVLENTITISNGLASIVGAGGRKLNYFSNNSNFRYYAASNDTKVSLYKKLSTEPVADVYSETITVSKSSTTIPLGDSETITAIIDQAATVRTVTWESNNAKVHVVDGAISVDSDATVNSTATITAKVPASAAEDDFLTATCVVTVGPAKLTGLQRNGYDAFYIGQKISDYQGGAITASWTAGDNSAISLDDAHLSITLGGNAVTKDTVLTADDNGKQIQFTYTDPNYDGVSKFTSNRAISVGEFFAIDDMVAHFDDDNAYILSTSDSGNNYLSFSYTSWGGEATIDSVTSSKDDLVIATLTDHAFSNRSGTGTIGLLTDGESKGQAIITLTATVESITIQKSFVVTVRNTAPSVTPGATSYELVNSLNDVTTGNYVIAANVDGTYYAMSNTFASKIDGSVVSVSNGKISADMSDYVVTLTRSGSNLSIFNGSLYLKVQSGSTTNLGTQEAVFYNTIADGNVANRGSFKISNTRALSYRAGTTNQFGNYATNNITTSGEYYYVELFKEVSEGGTADDTTVVQNFVTAYMQPSIDPSHTSDTGACRGENGYYNVAKTHLSTDLNGAQRLIFRDDFDAYYQRMVKWGIACTENFSIDNDGNIVTSPRNAGALSSFSNNVGSVTSAFVVVSVVGLAAVGGMIFLRKRRAI